jgi:hypothetical protein
MKLLRNLWMMTSIMVPASSAWAEGGSSFRLMEPSEVYIDAYQIDEMHDSYLAPIDQELKLGAAFVVDVDVLRYGHYGLWMNNKVHFDQSETTGHIRHGGWEFELGLTLIATEQKPLLSVIRLHHSRHLMEGSREEHFPVYDMTGIRLHIVDF